MRYVVDDGEPDDGRVPEMEHTGGWKESQYHPRLGAIILTRLHAGETIKQVCADPDMPSQATLHRWRHMHAEFWHAYEGMIAARAAERRAVAAALREAHRRWALAQAKAGRRRTRTWVAGAPSTYDRRWAEAFCARVARGEAVYRICAEPGMPSTKAVYGWLKRRPEFVAMYRDAKDEGVAWLRFQAEIAGEQVMVGPLDLRRVCEIRREMAALEGRAGRVAAKGYR